MTTAEDRPRRRPRRLRDDERKLWVEVARSVKPLKSRPLAEAPAPADGPESAAAAAKSTRPRAAAAKPAASPPPKATLPKAPAPAKAPPPARPPVTPAALAPSLAPALAPLGRRLRQRIGRGSEPIARRLDLHGMTQHEAHHALSRFLFAAQSEDARLVLVITGKGLRNDGDPYAERGVLRRLVPQWLRLPELRAVVVGFESAGIGHGGEGALYVRLRRTR